MSKSVKTLILPTITIDRFKVDEQMNCEISMRYGLTVSDTCKNQTFLLAIGINMETKGQSLTLMKLADINKSLQKSQLLPQRRGDVS